MYHDSCPLDYKVYVGSPGNNGNKSELEVWVARNPPCFAFVEFEDPQEVANTVQELDGRTLCGCPIIIRGGVLHLDTDLQDGEASPAAVANPFLEMG
ncbi:hypothetical protein FD755_024694 [Muntiacus reevesi]|uniref:RRM domain-containing protein n=1 Tax=Muntiacus reevesi TaxID=9886 RepID=A0A5N3UVN5_MUNRE|nr:hypothetical protein FD755_024694 [Muntiacus reevesi]